MKTINISIAGIGNVGSHVIKYLSENNKFIYNKTKIKFNIIGISGKNYSKKRIFNINDYKWYKNPLDLISNSNTEILIELIGQTDGISYQLIKEALLNNIHVVTANKALLAKHGNELFQIADKNNVLLLFEASVAGGIPVIKLVRQSIFLNQIKKISGILNGTTNYILSKMHSSNKNFEEILKEAQIKGFAEANPLNDIEGIDAAHKLCILSVVCFGVKFNFKNIIYKGVSNINVQDITFVQKLGYQIKLVGFSEFNNNKLISVVEPILVKKNSKLANVNGVQNGIQIETNQLQSLFLEGEGAGGIPTSSAIISDLYEIAKNSQFYSLGYKAENLIDVNFINYDEKLSSYYLKIIVKDIPGVLAKITTYLNEQGISIETILQMPNIITSNLKDSVPIIITTHETKTKLLNNVINKIENLEFVMSKIVVIGIDKNIL